MRWYSSTPGFHSMMMMIDEVDKVENRAVKQTKGPVQFSTTLINQSIEDYEESHCISTA